MWSNTKVRVIWASISIALLAVAFFAHLSRWWVYGILILILASALYLQVREKR
jgi:ABC-type transport system involved in cytochrome bd biosynthesis fused ATPase/permease subunit